MSDMKVCYKTSRDYQRLKELLDQGYEVVCFTTYDLYRGRPEKAKQMIVTDVCRAKLIKGSMSVYDRYLIGVRGHTFIDYWVEQEKRWTFEEECEAENIEFIEPTIRKEE